MTKNIKINIESKNLVLKIFIAVLIGIALGYCLNIFNILWLETFLELLGNLFVGALKAIAPILVFVLISESIATKEFTNNSSKGLKKIIILYVIGTLLASLCAIVASFIFPIDLVLNIAAAEVGTLPQDISKVLINLTIKAVDNPVNALATGNFIALILWAVGLGLAFRATSQNTKDFYVEIAQSITEVVKYIINLAPIGICGLVATSIAQTGAEAIYSYAKLVILLVLCMLFVAFIINALIVFVITKKNPYPLIFACIKGSAITAFFTRSSAANIPVNITLAKKLNIDEQLYSVSIPLGATINMAGAAITISILTLATTNTLGIIVDFPTALLLCFVSSIAACGTSGIAGGSLMLVPLACALFGISNDIALQVVAIGFVIGVIQDSFETALNSSTDVLFTAAISQSQNSQN